MGLTSAVLLWSCAAGHETDDTGPGGAPADDDGQGASGAAGGAGGGTGGSGGTGTLCEQDCSEVMPPECYQSVCNDGSYPGPVGACTVVPVENGTACDDGMFCTANDTCQDGQCTAGPPNDCSIVPSDCLQVTCDEDTDQCATEAAPNGEPCTSANLCIVDAICQNGVCSGGTFNDCFFAPVPDDCHVPVCNPITGNCEPVPGNDGESCTDPSDPCLVEGTCSAGQCGGATPKDCSHLSAGCDVGLCDSSNGACITQTVMDGQLCDDQDPCTTGETCDMGSCNNGSPVTTCSQTKDSCCPSNCTAADDIDCACPGTFVDGVCVYLTSPSTSYSLSGAQAACQALGTGWDLCTPSLLCNAQTFSYLAGEGCSCTGGAAGCSCGSAANLYVHIIGGTSPYYIRAPEVPNCGANACTNSVSETCGVALCCKP